MKRLLLIIMLYFATYAQADNLSTTPELRTALKTAATNGEKTPVKTLSGSQLDKRVHSVWYGNVTTKLKDYTFGGTWKTAKEMKHIKEYKHINSGEAVLTARVLTKGSGGNGQSSSDAAMSLESVKEDYLTSKVLGEVDGMNVLVRQSKLGDASCFLGNIQKVYNTGYGITGIELSMSNLDSNGIKTQSAKHLLGKMVGSKDRVSGDKNIALFSKAMVGDIHGIELVGDKANGNNLVNIISAYSDKKPSDLVFQVNTGSDKVSPTIVMGFTDRCSIKHTNGTLQILDSADAPIATFTSSTKDVDFKAKVKVGGETRIDTDGGYIHPQYALASLPPVQVGKVIYVVGSVTENKIAYSTSSGWFWMSNNTAVTE